MTEYMVATSNLLSEIETKVDNYLKKRWKLQGGVSAAFDSDGTPYYFQAMTLTRNEHGDIL